MFFLLVCIEAPGDVYNDLLNQTIAVLSPPVPEIFTTPPSPVCSFLCLCFCTACATPLAWIKLSLEVITISAMQPIFSLHKSSVAVAFERYQRKKTPVYSEDICSVSMGTLRGPDLSLVCACLCASGLLWGRRCIDCLELYLCLDPFSSFDGDWEHRDVTECKVSR